MLIERRGLIVWVSDIRAAKTLERYGSLHYISKKMRYAVLYVDADRSEEICQKLKNIKFVKRIEFSYRNELKTEYNSHIPDKTRTYSL